MVDLTVLILTKNEEKNLRKCIESFKGIAKRFVIVDSGSTDDTVNIAKQLHADVYCHDFKNHAEQFNWGINNTDITTEWVMRMDADEELTEELTDEIDSRLGDVPPSVSGIIVRRRLIFMGRWIKHGGRYPEYLLRIFRNGKAMCEQKIMDEHLVLSEGTTLEFKNDLIDNNQKDLDWWTAKHNWYSNREVLDHQMTVENQIEKTMDDGGKSSSQAAMKRKIKNGGYYRLPMFLRAHIYFIYRYYIKLGFLDGKEGKIFHFLQAYWYRFLVDAKMYECEKKGIKMTEQGDLKA